MKAVADTLAVARSNLIERVSRRAKVSRIESPTAMPTESLTCLKRSRSITINVGLKFGMVLAKFATALSRSMNSLPSR